MFIFTISPLIIRHLLMHWHEQFRKKIVLVSIQSPSFMKYQEGLTSQEQDCV